MGSREIRRPSSQESTGELVEGHSELGIWGGKHSFQTSLGKKKVDSQMRSPPSKRVPTIAEPVPSAAARGNFRTKGKLLSRIEGVTNGRGGIVFYLLA